MFNSLQLLLLCPLLCAGCARPNTIEPQLDAPAPEVQSHEVSLLTFGDWGQMLGDRQLVADAMAAYVSDHHPVDAALLLGDNYYVKLKDTEDPQIQKLFENTYDRTKLDFPFYAVLGNHDYQSHDDVIELQYRKKHPDTRWRMPARWYRLDLPSPAEPLVTVLMLDSNKPNMSSGDWVAELQWMKKELSKPRGKWTICCAHHTIFSNGAHGDNGALAADWGKLLRDKKVDFYVCGHDHDLQHLEIPDWSPSFIVSGGGTTHRTMRRDNRGPYSHSGTGFTYLDFTDSTATARIIDGHGRLLHEFTRDKTGGVTILSTTPSDPASTHQLKVMEGFEGVRQPSATQPAVRPER